MSAATVRTTTDLGEALTLLEAADYVLGDITLRMQSWLAHGNAVVVFENVDLCHREAGHRIAMSAPVDNIPAHGPDHPSIGLGWRYVPVLVVTTPEEG